MKITFFLQAAMDSMFHLAEAANMPNARLLPCTDNFIIAARWNWFGIAAQLMSFGPNHNDMN